MTTNGCEEVRSALPDVALGIADGEERELVLAHTADCLACQERLAELASVADGLVGLTPSAEPPAGFEERALAALPAPSNPGTGRPIRSLVLAVVGAGIAGALLVWFALGDERRIAGEYREVLAVANGTSFEATHLEAPGGRNVGYVYGYEGRTSWLLAVLYDMPRGRYRLVSVDPSGTETDVAAIAVAGERGASGGAIAGDFADVAEVRILDARGRELAEAELGEGD